MSSAPLSHPRIAVPGRVVGIDLGSRRIGVAVTDSAQRVATGATVVRRSGDRSADHRALAELVADYAAVGVVAGLPVSLSGHVGPAAAAVLQEVDELRHALPVEVETVDERLTTRTAARGLQRGGPPGARPSPGHRPGGRYCPAADLDRAPAPGRRNATGGRR